MEEKNKMPMLLEFLFGEVPQACPRSDRSGRCGINLETAPAKNAGQAQRGASERLIHWGEAFDEWLAEQGRRCKPCWAACGVD